jgi:hypothetical protein
MNQQEVNFELLINQGIVQVSETPMLTEYIVFGKTNSYSTCSTSFENKEIKLIQ